MRARASPPVHQLALSRNRFLDPAIGLPAQRGLGALPPPCTASCWLPCARTLLPRDPLTGSSTLLAPRNSSARSPGGARPGTPPRPPCTPSIFIPQLGPIVGSDAGGLLSSLNQSMVVPAIVVDGCCERASELDPDLPSRVALTDLVSSFPPPPPPSSFPLPSGKRYTLIGPLSYKVRRRLCFAPFAAAFTDSTLFCSLVFHQTVGPCKHAFVPRPTLALSLMDG